MTMIRAYSAKHSIVSLVKSSGSLSRSLLGRSVLAWRKSDSGLPPMAGPEPISCAVQWTAPAVVPSVCGRGDVSPASVQSLSLALSSDYSRKHHHGA